MSIHEMLNVKDEYLLSLVPDYKINLITPYDMDAENLKKLRSSLREVLEFIKYSEDKEKVNMCKAWDDMAKECEEKRYEDLERANEDAKYRETVYREFGL